MGREYQRIKERRMETVQAPNIDIKPGSGGRLVYDKARRTIVAQQAPIPDHPLAQFGYRRPPHWLWRRSQRVSVIVAAIQDIWLVMSGRCSLHRAWQSGHDHGTRHEYQRTVVNGGR
jgi:hypothetical protein